MDSQASKHLDWCLNKAGRENYQRQKPKIQAQQRQYRQNNKILRSINHQRTQQKIITLQMIENGNINPYEVKFKSILPTF